MSGGFGGKKNKVDPQAPLVALNKVIDEGSFQRIHLLYGEEDYLRYQFRDNLVKAMGGEPGSLSFNRFKGKDVNPGEVIGLAETMPFMAERRVILIEDTGWYVNGCSEMEEYVSSGICESTCLVFCEREVNKTTAMYKRTDKAGMISCFMTQEERVLISWVGSLMRAERLMISSSDASYMISVVGTDMVTLSSEAGKLASYCMDRDRVTRADIDAICSRTLEDRIFDMCEDVANGQKRGAMKKYYDLIVLRARPEFILIQVTRHFNTLIRVMELDSKKKNDEDIGALVGHPGWSIKKYRIQNRRYGHAQLRSILELCADTDMRIKRGEMEKGLAVETLMTRLLNGI